MSNTRETSRFALRVAWAFVKIQFCRAICREAARVVAPGGWLVIVSHINPSTVEGIVLLSEVMVPGLQDSASAGEEEFFWSVDVHCGSGGGDGSDSEESGSGDGGGGSCHGGSGSGGGGSDSGADGEKRNGEDRRVEAAEEEDEGSGNGDSDSLGPSVYMARKVGEAS